MFYLDYKDFLIIVIKSFVLSIIIVSLVIGISFLLKFNYDLANYVCSITKIPQNLAITPVSLGFRNNLIVVISLSQLGIIYYIYEKLKITCIYKKIYNFLIN